jgi:molecular chaperone GrpE
MSEEESKETTEASTTEEAGSVDEASSNGAEETSSAEAAPAEVDPVEQARTELKNVRDQLLRTAADFDNFRKRTRREMADVQKQAREDFLRDLLPVFDNLERATQHAQGTTDVAGLAQGIEMVMRMFHDTLGRLGVERVGAMGMSFDPALHEAIQQVETADHPPGTVTAEVQPGYRLGDRLIRPALVIVAKAPAPTS